MHCTSAKTPNQFPNALLNAIKCLLISNKILCLDVEMLKTFLPDHQPINVVVKFVLNPIKGTVCMSHRKHSVYDMGRPITHNNK